MNGHCPIGLQRVGERMKACGRVRALRLAQREASCVRVVCQRTSVVLVNHNQKYYIFLVSLNTSS